MEKHTSAAAYLTSACTTIAGGITLQELAVWVGIWLSFATFIVNWYYKYKDDKRAERTRDEP